MCNLYSMIKGQAAICDTFRATIDHAGNLPPLPDVFPDQVAPVVLQGPEGRELTTMRWGFPPPPGLTGTRPVTNIRNTPSAYWRAWMNEAHRCLVPVDMFCEYAKPTAPGQPAVPHWFALSEDRPLFAFAGLWRPWTGTRGPKAAAVTGEHRLYAFLTCPPNAVVGPVHPKAMPVMLTTPEEWDTWLTAPVAEALALQRPLPAELMRSIPHGPKAKRPDVEAPQPAKPRQSSLF